MKEKILGFFITIIFSTLLFFSGMDNREALNPTEVYQVYLNGQKIGIINSKDELYSLIDEEQTEIKNKYNVDKVYPPNGLDVKKVYTYDKTIVDVNTIYELIKDQEPFTIEAYNATIKYNSDKMGDEDTDAEELKREDIHIYLMDKDILNKALYNTAAAFISSSELEHYENGTQTEIDETGETISSVYFDETISIKKDLVSTEEYIFADVSELSRYLLFGTLEEQQRYVIKDGENLSTIADNHRLNVEELLIANPNYPSSDVLLAAGDTINVGLINPLVSVVYKKMVVEDIKVAFKEELVKDKTKYRDYYETKQEGQDGITRISQEITYTNGEIKSLDIVKQEEIQPVMNKIIVVGGKNHSGYIHYEEPPITTDEWAWPTITPFVITSGYKWRWGRMHQGIDISGCGSNSPIYAVNDGVVYKVNKNRNLSEGLSVYIEHANGYVTVYMHMNKVSVKEGQQVKKQQRIGGMGCTGRCTGTHLHIGVYKGRPYQGGTPVDPCKSIFKC